jgi:hypothetical protein
VGFFAWLFLERDPSVVGTDDPEASGEDTEGRMATSSAWAVGKFFKSEPSREVMSELRDDHHSPEGSLCMRAYLRFRGRSGEASGASMDFDGSDVVLSVPTEAASGLGGMTVSRSRIESVTRKED